jgi:hypothetical protein
VLSHPSDKNKDVCDDHPKDEDLSLGTPARMGHPALVAGGDSKNKDWLVEISRGTVAIDGPNGLGFQPPRIMVEVKHRKGTMGAPEVAYLVLRLLTFLERTIRQEFRIVTTSEFSNLSQFTRKSGSGNFNPSCPARGFFLLSVK